VTVLFKQKQLNVVVESAVFWLAVILAVYVAYRQT